MRYSYVMQFKTLETGLRWGETMNASINMSGARCCHDNYVLAGMFFKY